MENWRRWSGMWSGPLTIITILRSTSTKGNGESVWWDSCIQRSMRGWTQRLLGEKGIRTTTRAKSVDQRNLWLSLLKELVFPFLQRPKFQKIFDLCNHPNCDSHRISWNILQLFKRFYVKYILLKWRVDSFCVIEWVIKRNLYSKRPTVSSLTKAKTTSETKADSASIVKSAKILNELWEKHIVIFVCLLCIEHYGVLLHISIKIVQKWCLEIQCYFAETFASAS